MIRKPARYTVRKLLDKLGLCTKKSEVWIKLCKPNGDFIMVPVRSVSTHRLHDDKIVTTIVGEAVWA